MGPLFKALGKNVNTVIDATCGSGVDSMFFLALGYEVYAYERNPLVAFLLEEAISFYLNFDSDFANELKRFHFQNKDISKIDNIANESSVLYYDPMFPAKKKKSALARKEMEVFKVFVGEDADQQDTLQKLFSRFKGRVIVKRPLKAAPILPGVSSEFLGKTTRYDLYLKI